MMNSPQNQVPTPEKKLINGSRACKNCGNELLWYHKKCRACGTYMGNSKALTALIIAIFILIGGVYLLIEDSIKKQEKKANESVKIISHEVQEISGGRIIVIEYEWTNTTDHSTSFKWEYVDDIFQDGIECKTYYAFNSDARASTEIQPDKTYRFKEAYKLNDNVSDVQVTVHRLMHKGDNIVDETISIKE